VPQGSEDHGIDLCRNRVGLELCAAARSGDARVAASVWLDDSRWEVKRV
jgi:hypothetical protein